MKDDIYEISVKGIRCCAQEFMHDAARCELVLDCKCGNGSVLFLFVVVPTECVALAVLCMRISH